MSREHASPPRSLRDNARVPGHPPQLRILNVTGHEVRRAPFSTPASSAGEGDHAQHGGGGANRCA